MILALRTLLAWLFGPSLETLLGVARSHGSVLLQDEAGAGWYCTIQPSTDRLRGRERRINVWSGRQPSARAAVLEAIDEAVANPVATFDETPHAPKLGGAEFDR